MRKKGNNVRLVIYLIIITLICSFKVYFAYFACNGYAFADWLINYQEDGFSRRGLLGTVFVFLYETFSIKLQYSVFFAQTLVHVLFFYFLYKIAEFKKANVIDVLFLLTPFCLWGFFSDAAIGARKDGILWLLFVAFVYFLIKNELTKKKEIVFLFLFFLSVFIHESYIFYAQYFLMAIYFHRGALDLKRAGLILLSFYIPAGIVLLSGVNTDYHNTLRLIKECQINLQEENIFQWKETQLIKVDYYLKEYKNLSLYFISLLFQLVFVIFYMYIKKFSSESIRKLLAIFAVAFFVSIPLFLIAIDMGRWIYNNFILFSILLLSLIPVSKMKFFDVTIFRDYRMLIFIFLILCANFLYRVPSALMGIQQGLPLRLFLHFF